MNKAFLLVVGSLLIISACSTQKMVCPAYQSAFIHDQVALRKKFSYFNEDSTPKVYTVSKNKYLIIPEQSYRKKIRSMQTIEMKPIYPKVPDSLQAKDDEFKGAEQDEATADSLAATTKEAEDSVYAISKDKEVRLLKYDRDSAKYRVVNVRYTSDQDIYMWYFRDVLVLPDVKAAMEEEKNAKEGKTNATAKGKKEKQGIRGFFRNMLRKNKKPKSDSTTVQGPPPSPTSDSTSSVEKKEKKGGLFKRKKTEPKVTQKEPEKKKDPAKKEEDDGF